MKSTHQIFISYTTRGDGDAAFRLVDLLEASGAKCWIAPRDIEEGNNWADAIPEAIDTCQLVVLLLSNQSMDSEEIKKEVNLANSRDKKILPVRLENIPLRASFEYHLATRQWIDAFEGGFDTRFSKTIEAVTRDIKIQQADLTRSSHTSDLGKQVSAWVSQLNYDHQALFESTNTFFSLHFHGDDRFNIRLPIRFAACAAELVMAYCGPNLPVDFYVNTAGQGNPIKWRLLQLLEGHFGERSKSLKIHTNARRWRVAELAKIALPDTGLPLKGNMPLQLYQNYVAALVQDVIPNMVAFMQRGRYFLNMILSLESNLLEAFPLAEGWKIEAPRGLHLRDFVKGGRINIYKQEWQQEENRRCAGLLSFTLMSEGECLHNMYIKIAVYDRFIETGDALIALKQVLKKLPCPPVDAESLWAYLPEDLRWPNLLRHDPELDGHADRFNAEVTARLLALKALTPLVDEAVREIRQIQARPWDELHQLPWNALLVRSALENGRKNLIMAYPELEVGEFAPWVIHFWDPTWKHAACMRKHFRFQDFDIALDILLGRRSFDIRFCSVDLPHYETEILKSLVKGTFSHLSWSNAESLCLGRLEASVDFDRKSPWEWLSHFPEFVDNHLPQACQILMALQAFIQERANYIHSVQLGLRVLFPEHEGWVMEDHIFSLREQNGGFLLWNNRWSHKGEAAQNTPSLVVQVGYQGQLFSRPFLAIRCTRHERMESYAVGCFVGWCSARLGQGTIHEGYLWYLPLPDDSSLDAIMTKVAQLKEAQSLILRASIESSVTVER